MHQFMNWPRQGPGNQNRTSDANEIQGQGGGSGIWVWAATRNVAPQASPGWLWGDIPGSALALRLGGAIVRRGGPCAAPFLRGAFRPESVLLYLRRHPAVKNEMQSCCRPQTAKLSLAVTRFPLSPIGAFVVPQTLVRVEDVRHTAMQARRPRGSRFERRVGTGFILDRDCPPRASPVSFDGGAVPAAVSCVSMSCACRAGAPVFFEIVGNRFFGRRDGKDKKVGTIFTPGRSHFCRIHGAVATHSNHCRMKLLSPWGYVH